MSLAVFALLSNLVLVSPGSPDSCVQYEPVPVRLVGLLIRRVLPGPPNYESVEAGDTPEPTFFIILEKRLCVEADSTEYINAIAEMAVDTVQVGPADGDWAPLRRLVDSKVQVDGTLFHAHTGHHRTAVIMRATDIKALAP